MTDVSTDGFLRRLLQEVPGLEPAWTEHLRDHDEALPYVFLGDVTRQAFLWHRLEAADARGSLAALTAFMESEYEAGGSPIRRLIEQGFLENLAGPPEAGWRVRERLGPVLRSRIEAMWPS